MGQKYEEYTRTTNELQGNACGKLRKSQRRQSDGAMREDGHSRLRSWATFFAGKVPSDNLVALTVREQK